MIRNSNKWCLVTVNGRVSFCLYSLGCRHLVCVTLSQMLAGGHSVRRVCVVVLGNVCVTGFGDLIEMFL